MWPPNWPPGATVEHRAGAEVSIRVDHDDFLLEASPSALALTSATDPGETADLSSGSAEALAIALGWYLSDASLASGSITTRIDGPHAPIHVAVAVGGNNIIVTMRSPFGRPWILSVPRLSAATLRDSLRAVSQVSWDSVAAGGPTVTVTTPADQGPP